jgi:peptidoglycan/LPS O-acetylase OafA/YrhL
LANPLGIALIAVSSMVWWQWMAVIGSCLMVASERSALKPLAWVGRRAYSIYLWSWPLVLMLGGPLALVPTLAAAEISYRFIELPMIARFGRQPVRSVAPGNEGQAQREGAVDGRPRVPAWDRAASAS